jgi:hypothetical protein
MLYKLAAYIQVTFARRARRIVAALEGERGQGTVEYVGLILLVSLLMVGMVAAMKGFNRSRSYGRYLQTVGACVLPLHERQDDPGRPPPPPGDHRAPF